MRPLVIPTIILILIFILVFLNFKKKNKVDTKTNQKEIEPYQFTLNNFWSLLSKNINQEDFFYKQKDDVKFFLERFDELINIINKKENFEYYKTHYSQKTDFLNFKIFIISNGENFFVEFQKNPKMLNQKTFEKSDIYLKAVKKYKELFKKSYIAKLEQADW